MTPARTASRLVRLYPAAWRTRYGDELQTLILEMTDGRHVPWRVRADVAGAGGREWLRSAGLGEGSPDGRVRGGAGLVLWAWALFVVAGAIVQKSSEHWQQALPTGSHVAAKVAFDGLIGVAIVTAGLVLAGIAVTLPALTRLVRGGGWSRMRRPVIRAGAVSVVFVAATIGVVVWAHGLSASDRQGHDAAYGIALSAWALLGAGTLGAWTAAAIRAAACLTLPAPILRLEARLAAAVTATMGVMVAATAAWWVAVGSVAPSALTGSPGGHVSAFVPQLVVAMVLMLLALALGVAGARRATGALSGLDGAAPA